MELLTKEELELDQKVSLAIEQERELILIARLNSDNKYDEFESQR